jgi:hypothetical protein
MLHSCSEECEQGWSSLKCVMPAAVLRKEWFDHQARKKTTDTDKKVRRNGICCSEGIAVLRHTIVSKLLLSERRRKAPGCRVRGFSSSSGRPVLNSRCAQCQRLRKCGKEKFPWTIWRCFSARTERHHRPSESRLERRTPSRFCSLSVRRKLGPPLSTSGNALEVARSAHAYVRGTTLKFYECADRLSGSAATAISAISVQ